MSEPLGNRTDPRAAGDHGDLREEPIGELLKRLSNETTTLLWGAVAGVLALQGKNKLQDAAPPAPEQTIETVKEDVQWAKTQKPSART